MLRPLPEGQTRNSRNQNGDGTEQGRKLQQLLTLWNALDGRKRLIVALAGISVFAAVLMLARMAATPSMALLYAGLDAPVAGEVVAALEQRGVTYSVQGDAIYVDSGQRDLMRMELAGQGLPTTGAAGYELLDNLTGFGTTAQMFDAAYWRAKEGELARTILAWPQIRSARVHIANPVSRPFAQSPAPVASVTLNLASGALSGEQARALRFLVASAVPGMAPADVAVIDGDRGLLPTGDGAGAAAADSRADALRKRVERLLAARVGTGNAVVEVALETTLDQERITERRLDPDSRVAISTDSAEVTGSTSDSDNGQVTVASNLPDGDAGAGESSRSSSAETRERVNYEVSETTRELLMQPGKIRRLSVAVIVNSSAVVGPNGAAVTTPRPDEELAALRELVESAVGYDETRGDVVTLKSMDFQPLPEAGTLAAASPLSGLFANMATLIQTAVLALVALALGLFVLRPALTAQPVPPALPAPGPGLDGEIADDPALPGMARPGLADLRAEEDDDPVALLHRIISERQDDSAEILRNWIEADEETA